MPTACSAPIAPSPVITMSVIAHAPQETLGYMMPTLMHASGRPKDVVASCTVVTAEVPVTAPG